MGLILVHHYNCDWSPFYMRVDLTVVVVVMTKCSLNWPLEHVANIYLEWHASTMRGRSCPIQLRIWELQCCTILVDWYRPILLIENVEPQSLFNSERWVILLELLEIHCVRCIVLKKKNEILFSSADRLSGRANAISIEDYSN